jgi:hypothetical protein
VNIFQRDSQVTNDSMNSFNKASKNLAITGYPPPKKSVPDPISKNKTTFASQSNI